MLLLLLLSNVIKCVNETMVPSFKVLCKEDPGEH
uniref:Uncharacterized protein n=1 Tax=Rhizophora mucronata TaxID=61149 RepID=A0A2P2Q0E3_RHIMU